MLQLLHEALPQSTYRRANAALRDAGRPLSALRDAAVLGIALTRLMKSRGASHAGFGRALAHERRAINAATRAAGLALTRRSLRAVCKDAARWRVGRHGWSVLGKGLRRVYGNGRRSFSIVRGYPGVEELHEWRKQVKYLWHELAFLKSQRAPLLRGRGRLSHTLANYLGEDHDLAILRVKALAHRDTFSSAARRRMFFALIDQHRARLQRKVLALGARIYRERPSRFAARVGHSWHKRRSK